MISALLFEMLAPKLFSLHTLANMSSHRNVLPIQLDIPQSIGLLVFAQLLFVARLPVRPSRQSAFSSKLHRGHSVQHSIYTNIFPVRSCALILTDVFRADAGTVAVAT